MSKTAKRVLACVGFLLVGVLLTVLVSNLLGIAEWDMKKPNKDNLYQSLTFFDDDGKFASGEDGIKITLDDDNVLKVKGTAEATKTYTIGTTTLKEGISYVFDSGLENGSNGTVYMSVRNTQTDSVIKSSYSGAVVISALDADTAVSIEITIVDETEINEDLCVILCEGESVKDAVKFWA